MINAEVIQLTMLRTKGRRRNGSELCACQLISSRSTDCMKNTF